jgi:hypothetical protein
MAQPGDTAPEADRVLTEVYRRMSPGEKWLRLGQMYRDARLLHAAGVRLRNPAATPRDIHEAWLLGHLGFAYPELISEPAQEHNISNLHEVRAVVTIFTNLGIPYALGGSLASSVHGIDRYTRDADITAEPFPGKETQLQAAFGPAYYVSLPAIQEAIRNRSSFNIINTSTGFKVDVFIRKDTPFEESAMQRRLVMELPDLPAQPIALQTPEDLILFKLRWYRLGEESSTQQWNDVLGVLKVQGEKLDNPYLDRWAADLQVSDLLARARQEVVG